MKQQRVGIANWVVAVWMVAALVLAGCNAAAPSFTSSENAAPPPMAPSSGGEAVAQGEEGSGAAETNRKIIARAAMTMIVADTQATTGDINSLMDELGGYVASSNFYRYSSDPNEAMQGSISLRVPSEKLQTALDALSAMAVEVNSNSLNREDVTDQYTDVDAQIRNLEATETELVAMLEEVRERPNSTSEDIMAVYRTLTEVRGQIETLQGRKNMWDNLIALSTIDVTLIPDSANLPVVDEGWRPGAVVREAQRALVGGLQVLGSVIIWFGIVVLPMLLLMILPLIVLFFILRWLFRKFSKPKPEPELATAPPPAPST